MSTDLTERKKDASKIRQSRETKRLVTRTISALYDIEEGNPAYRMAVTLGMDHSTEPPTPTIMVTAEPSFKKEIRFQPEHLATKGQYMAGGLLHRSEGGGFLSNTNSAKARGQNDVMVDGIVKYFHDSLMKAIGAAPLSHRVEHPSA